MSTVSYYLCENPLSTSDENAYMARVKNALTLDQDDLIEVMLGKNTTVTRQDIVVVLDLLKESIKEQVLAGNTLLTDIFKARVSIKGGFTDYSDEFDSDRHKVCVNMNAATEFKKDLAYSAKLDRIKENNNAPMLKQVYSYATKSYTTELSAGGLITIKGGYFYSDGEETSVYLKKDGVGDIVPITMIHTVSDSNILCNLPNDVEAGDYKLYVSHGEGDDAKGDYLKSMITIS